MPHIETVKDSQGRSLPSVTQILSVIDKPFVDKWAVKHSTTKANIILKALCVEPDHALSLIKDKTLEEYKFDRDNFWLSGEDLGKKAANRGKNFHQAVEDFYNGVKPTKETENLYKLLDQYLTLRGFSIHEIEKLVMHEKLGYRGTLDVALKADDSLIVADWKFTNSIHLEQLLQLAGYGQAYIDGPVKGLIVRIAERKAKPRKESILDFPELGYVIEERKVEDLSTLYPTFNACLEIWKFLNSGKKHD